LKNRFESCLAALWALCYDDVSTKHVENTNAIRILCLILKSRNTSITPSARNIAFKALWLITNVADKLDEVVNDHDMMPVTLRTALNADAPATLRLTACQFLVRCVCGNILHFTKFSAS
jgi:hypothetical protein